MSGLIWLFSRGTPSMLFQFVINFMYESTLQFTLKLLLIESERIRGVDIISYEGFSDRFCSNKFYSASSLMRGPSKSASSLSPLQVQVSRSREQSVFSSSGFNTSIICCLFLNRNLYRTRWSRPYLSFCFLDFFYLFLFLNNRQLSITYS